MESKITNDMPIRIITCKENEVLSMFKLGNIYIYLPIPAKFFTKLGFKIFLGIKLEKNYKEEKKIMNKYIAHFRTITKHKLLVMKFCFKCGLIWRGLMHDNSKFGPTEFWASARYWQGSRSPIDAEKEIKGYSLAWQHHKGHNPHHWEYWLDNLGTYKNDGLKMPIEYVIEMICDWLAAGIIYNGNKVNYDEPYDAPRAFYNSKKKECIFHPETQKLIEHFLDEIAEEGINYFCEYWKYEEITYEYVNGRLQG